MDDIITVGIGVDITNNYLDIKTAVKDKDIILRKSFDDFSDWSFKQAKWVEQLVERNKDLETKLETLYLITKSMLRTLESNVT